MKKHLHHIIPRHMGGTDDPSNLIELTTKEHAEAHRKLWEEHHNEYDRIAWQCLSGQIGNEEANILATKTANTGRDPWNKGKTGLQKSTRKGIPRTEEERKMISEGTKKAMIGVKCGTPKGTEPWNKSKKMGPQSPELVKKRMDAMREARESRKKEGPEAL